MKNMKNIIVLVMVVMLLTGCTVKLKDDENNLVKNPKTGQVLTENIICKPTDAAVKQIYADNNVDITSLVECKDFKITSGGYEGLWTSFVVKPLAYVVILLVNLFNNAGIAIILASLLFKLLLFPLMQKNLKNSAKMKELEPEKNAINKKYENKTDQQSLMMKNQELSMLYKKNDISMMGGCLTALIQIPIFLGFLEAINRTPAIFEGNFLGLELGTTPLAGIQNGEFAYTVLLTLIILVSWLSYKKMLSTATGEQLKTMKYTVYFLLIITSISAFTFPAAIGLYWIVSSGFSIVQNYLLKKDTK